ncbi:MAG: type II/IV secretion system protein [Armatimonadetes bacterium]|nr:type II/IV secretion system protein [Armatimonadota bacterium]
MSRILDRLGDIVGDWALHKGLVSKEDWELVQQGRGSLAGSIGEILVNMSLVKETDLYLMIAQHLKFPLFTPEKFDPDMGLMSHIPADLQKHHALLPLKLEGNRLFVAMEDPGDVVVIDDLRRGTSLNIVPVLASPKDLARFLRHKPRHTQPVASQSAEEAGDSHSVGVEGLDDLEAMVTEAPVIRLFNVILREAIENRASDIHIEPGPKEVTLRYRIDGILYDIMPINRQTMYQPLIIRVKVMANIDIAEARKPQDGQFRVNNNKKTYDFRVSTLPTIHGEKAVLRLLDRANAFLRMEELGMNADVQQQTEVAVTKPHGLLLVAGPTGSGKTTTLYSLLHRSHTPERNFVTVEDPVEYTFPRINQVQVNRKAGMTFASVMRHLLRQDPDVILVGEIRDTETAKMAVEAAMTGHLVMSTIHTNDAPSTVNRLTDMGVEPFLIAGSLTGVLAQRLVRCVCDQCRQTVQPPATSLLAAGLPAEAQGQFYYGRGCTACRSSGYRGRTGIYEFLQMNEQMRELIVRRASVADLREAARHSGMKSMREDGLHKVLSGLTTLEEVVRVVETPE